MSSKKQLTPEQEALIPFYVEKWFKVAFNTTQIDRERAIKIIEYFYTIYLRKKIPQIVYCQNPYEAFKNIKNLHNNRQYNTLFRSRITGWQQIEQNLYFKLWEQLTKQIWWRLRFSSINSLIQKDLKQFFNKKDLRIDDRYKYKWDKFSDISSFYTDLNPEYWVGYNSFDDFCISVLNCHYSRKEWGMTKALAKHFYWTIFYEDLSIVCLRPKKISSDSNNRLHSEASPAIPQGSREGECEYSDGFKIYARHGEIFEQNKI